LTINSKEIDSAAMPKLIEIGTNRIMYNVTDLDGNFKTCAFTVEVLGKCFQLHLSVLTCHNIWTLKRHF
jgi:hypothetical protein